MTSRKAGHARRRPKERGGPSDHVTDVARIAVSDQMEARDGAYYSFCIDSSVGGRGQGADADQCDDSREALAAGGASNKENRPYRGTLADAG